MQQSLFCLYNKRKQIKSGGIQHSASQQQGFVYSPGKSQWKRSEKNRSWPGADISCSHLSRLTSGASRATGKEEDRGCKEREPVAQYQNWLFPHCSLTTQSRLFLHQVFIRHFPTRFTSRQHRGLKMLKRHAEFECFSAAKTALRGRCFGKRI